MNSPPKPNRRVTLGLPTGAKERRTCAGINTEEMVNVPFSGAGDMASFESNLIEKAVSDLPTLASHVFTLYEGQNSELSRQQEELEIQNKLINVGEEKLAELNGDLKCLTNKIFLAEQFNNDTNKRITSMDLDIPKLVTVIVDKETKLKNTKESSDLEKRKLEEDKQKMQKHSDLVEENIKSTSNTYAYLQEIKHEVDMLTEQMESIRETHSMETDMLVSGEVEHKLQEEIMSTKSKLQKFQKEAKLYETKIVEQNIKNSEISQNIQVAHKRNSAQLIRLRKQVNDLQSRNNQREQQLIKLKNDLTEGETRLAETQ